MNKGILIRSIIMPVVMQCGDPTNEDDTFVNFVLDVIFPKALDVLADDAPHMLKMT
jgi:hypothetical protein